MDVLMETAGLGEDTHTHTHTHLYAQLSRAPFKKTAVCVVIFKVTILCVVTIYYFPCKWRFRIF